MFDMTMLFVDTKREFAMYQLIVEDSCGSFSLTTSANLMLCVTTRA